VHRRSQAHATGHAQLPERNALAIGGHSSADQSIPARYTSGYGLAQTKNSLFSLLQLQGGRGKTLTLFYPRQHAVPRLTSARDWCEQLQLRKRNVDGDQKLACCAAAARELAQGRLISLWAAVVHDSGPNIWEPARQAQSAKVNAAA
jgi:hypothetical protein